MKIRPPKLRPLARNRVEAAYAWLEVFQRDTQTAIQQLADLPFADCVELTGVVLGPAQVRVAHGLGRAPKRWKIVDQTADARVWRSDVATLTHLPLTASAAVTVTLLVE